MKDKSRKEKRKRRKKGEIIEISNSKYWAKARRRGRRNCDRGIVG